MLRAEKSKRKKVTLANIPEPSTNQIMMDVMPGFIVNYYSRKKKISVRAYAGRVVDILPRLIQIDREMQLSEIHIQFSEEIPCDLFFTSIL
jgi:hypothetical protein